MPAYCEPWPENRKARRRLSVFAAPSSFAASSSASARRKSSSEEARAHERREKWVRPLVSVKDRSCALASGSRPIQDLHLSIDVRSVDGVLPENGNGANGGPSDWPL